MESGPNFPLDALLFLALTLTLRPKMHISILQAVDQGKEEDEGAEVTLCVFAGGGMLLPGAASHLHWYHIGQEFLFWLHYLPERCSLPS